MRNKCKSLFRPPSPLYDTIITPRAHYMIPLANDITLSQNVASAVLDETCYALAVLDTDRWLGSIPPFEIAFVNLLLKSFLQKTNFLT